MAVLKCKMCGGDIDVSADKSFGICQSCGCRVTLPKVDDERQAEWFNRGNSLRMRGEFDKAASVYEHIIAEDDSDAEAHWCLALCRYGIEYVEDPLSHQRIPTCHRTNLEPISSDLDCLMALKNSDKEARALYQSEVERIDEVQRRILTIVKQEKPFDVFICCREKDNGNRTKESIIAQDLYTRLDKAGLRTFFARVTLEDKLGTEFEPYIFAALNTARVMVVLGSSAEHFNSIWVKNEWSRFLALMKTDKGRVLIPCWCGMDPCDMPGDLSLLQGQDMEKIGFVQDLVCAVVKACREQPASASQWTAVPERGSVENLMQRAAICVKDGEFKKADELLERVLDQDPKNASAYYGKLMVELGAKNEKELCASSLLIARSHSYVHLLEFGDAAMCTRLSGFLSCQYDLYMKNLRQSISVQENKVRSIQAEMDNLERRYEDWKSSVEMVGYASNGIKIFGCGFFLVAGAIAVNFHVGDNFFKYSLISFIGGLILAKWFQKHCRKEMDSARREITLEPPYKVRVSDVVDSLSAEIQNRLNSAKGELDSARSELDHCAEERTQKLKELDDWIERLRDDTRKKTDTIAGTAEE